MLYTSAVTSYLFMLFDNRLCETFIELFPKMGFLSDPDLHSNGECDFVLEFVVLRGNRFFYFFLLHLLRAEQPAACTVFSPTTSGSCVTAYFSSYPGPSNLNHLHRKQKWCSRFHRCLSKLSVFTGCTSTERIYVSLRETNLQRGSTGASWTPARV